MRLADSVRDGADLIRVDSVLPEQAAALGDLLAGRPVEIITAHGADAGSLLLVGSRAAVVDALAPVASQPAAALAALASEIRAACENSARETLPPTRIGAQEFAWGARTYVMGIVNVTPDSFSGDGLLSAASPRATGETAAIHAAVEQALRFVEQGADIIDVGGESTRPGADTVDAATEARRVVPVIEALRRRSDAVISVDTYKASVAAAALDAGADLVNDIWALEADSAMAPLVSRRRVPVVLMHNRSRRSQANTHPTLGGHYVDVSYDDLMGEILADLRRVVILALEAGIPSERLIVDPGVGFGKTVAQNLELVNRVGELRVLGLPVLLGTSRKSFIGHVLDLPPEERLEGTAATVAVGMLRGAADIVRVHDVQAIARVTQMIDAITHPRAD